MAASRDKTLATRSDTREADIVAELVASFSGSPIPISFRSVVGGLPAEESTHALYPYPARLLRQIPRLLIPAIKGRYELEAIIDPFCGSGTVLVEGQRNGLYSVGIDSNPFAVLISAVKTTRVNEEKALNEAGRVVSLAKTTRRREPPAAFLSSWHTSSALGALSKLQHRIEDLGESKERSLLRLAFALTVRQTSLMDPRLPVPVRRREPSAAPTSREVWARFESNAGRMAERCSALPRVPRSKVATGDARGGDVYDLDDQRTAVVTSPPYGAAQKYARSTGLELGWLGLTGGKGVAAIEAASIGREHVTKVDGMPTLDDLAPSLRELILQFGEKDVRRATIYGIYFNEMRRWAKAVGDSRVKAVVMICGTNSVLGHEMPTHRYLADMLIECGFKERLCVVDTIRGRTLLTSRKHGMTPAASEYVYLFERK